MSAFPPADLESFLRFCAGEWLAVRSRFALAAEDARAEAAADGKADSEAEGKANGETDGKASAEADTDEGWHRSERGALVVTYLEAEAAGDVGGLRLTPPNATGGGAGGDAGSQQIRFEAGGSFVRQGADGTPVGGGRWAMGPDGSLELSERGSWGVVRERIWFTKPNLRLRSSVERGANGEPGRASFSSEIRRVSPATP